MGALLSLLIRPFIIPCFQRPRACLCGGYLPAANIEIKLSLHPHLHPLQLRCCLLCHSRRDTTAARAAVPNCWPRSIAPPSQNGFRERICFVTVWFGTSSSLPFIHRILHAPPSSPPSFLPLSPLESRPFFFIVIARSAQIDDTTSASAPSRPRPSLSSSSAMPCHRSRSPSLHLNFPGTLPPSPAPPYRAPTKL